MQPIYTRRRFVGLLGGTALAGAAAFSFGKAPVAIATTATPPAASPVPDSTANDLLLRIAYSGGFVPVEYLLTSMPIVSVYADGRVITTGPMIEIYPQPALPNLRETVLTEAGIASVIEQARAAGLFDGPVYYDGPEITDLPDTVFTVNADGVSTEVSAYGLGVDETMLPASANAEARAKLIEFQAFLTDLPANLPPEQIRTADAEYEIEKIKVYAREIDVANPPWDDPAMEQPEIAWPLSMPISQFAELSEGAFTGMSCAAFTSEDAKSIVEAFQGANQLTPWKSEDKLYLLWPRPLLPDEPANCS